MPKQALLDDHARIMAAVDANLRMISGPRPDNFDAMAGRRWTFAREFLLHCARDDAQILRPMTTDRRPNVAADAVRSRADLAELVEAFKAHVQRWAGLAGEAEWPTYTRATTALMARIRDRLFAEERGVYSYLPVQPSPRAPLAPANYAQEAWAIREAIFTGKAPA